MRYFGRERIEAILRSHIRWAQDFAALVDAHPKFERVAPVPLSVVCFRYQGSDDENRAILERVNASDRMFIASTVLNGKLTLRLAIGQLETSWRDVQEAWELLQKAAENI
jgi:aromatic-L-amino-acid/L-tryptophan decarboxylase